MRKHEMDQLPRKIRSRLTRGNNRQVEFVLVWEDDSGRNHNIAVTQADVRQLQLAKSAIYSGIRMLQSVMDVSDEQITELMLCGGFGNYINIESAKTIRLLPNLKHEQISYVGNAALLGAQMALLSETERLKTSDITKQIEHVALAARPDFQEIFMDSMAFKGEPFPSPSKSSSRERKLKRLKQAV